MQVGEAPGAERGTAALDDFGSVRLGGVWTFSLLLPGFVAYWSELDPQAPSMSDPSDSLVMFLHGVGANGADLAPLADTLLPFLPASVFAAPDGPERFDGGGSGRQWFSVAGVTQANRSERVQHARAAFDRVVSGEIEKHGFAGRFDRIPLFGFSQGAIMALDALATGRWPLRAVVAASGRLATAPEAKTEHCTKILLMHGENDPVIPVQETRHAAERLRAAGFEVEAKLYPGLGHVLSPEGIQAAGKFLARQLGHA